MNSGSFSLQHHRFATLVVSIVVCSGFGGSTQKSRYPCTYCACPNGQLSAPAPYRCKFCIALDTDIHRAREKEETERSNHEKELLSSFSHINRACRHHDFLDSVAQEAWKSIRDADDFQDIVKIIFPNNSPNALTRQEWAELGKLLEIDEEKTVRELGRSTNRNKKLDQKQWVQAISDWKKQYEVSYKNIDDRGLTEDRIDKVMTTRISYRKKNII